MKQNDSGLAEMLGDMAKPDDPGYSAYELAAQLGVTRATAYGRAAALVAAGKWRDGWAMRNGKRVRVFRKA